jgi:hypothetical protein
MVYDQIFQYVVNDVIVSSHFFLQGKNVAYENHISGNREEFPYGREVPEKILRNLRLVLDSNEVRDIIGSTS